MQVSLDVLNENHQKYELNVCEIQLKTTEDRRKEEERQNQKMEKYEKHEELHLSVGEYIKSIVYAGLDGTINSLVIIFSGIASNTDPYKILSFVIAMMLGDGLSMSLGDYLSAKTENQYIKTEAERQLYEVENMLDKEENQIIKIYKDKHYTQEQAQRLSQLYGTNMKAFVNIMMLEELGLVVSDTQEWKNGVVTFVAFVIFCFIPGIPYVITAGIMKDNSHHLITCTVIGVVLFFSIGIAKARLIGLNMQRAIMTGFEVLFIGTATVAVGYGIGVAFQ